MFLRFFPTQDIGIQIWTPRYCLHEWITRWIWGIFHHRVIYRWFGLESDIKLIPTKVKTKQYTLLTNIFAFWSRTMAKKRRLMSYYSSNSSSSVSICLQTILVQGESNLFLELFWSYLHASFWHLTMTFASLWYLQHYEYTALWILAAVPKLVPIARRFPKQRLLKQNQQNHLYLLIVANFHPQQNNDHPL